MYSQGGKFEVHMPPVGFLCPWQTSLIHPSVIVLRTAFCFFNKARWAGHYQVIRTGKQDTTCLPALSFPGQEE